MGKEKEHKSEPTLGAFTRMNYLYQAAHVIAKVSNSSILSNHYNKIMKEISKKLVEKLHPDLKRTVCSACNYPLTATSNDINVKIKSHIKRNKRKRNKKVSEKVESQARKFNIDKNVFVKYKKSRIEARNKKPNRVKWTCKCSFSKCFMQCPNYQIWIHKMPNNETNAVK